MTLEPENSFMPTYGEFDRVTANAIGEPSPLTATFVRTLFAKARRLRINAKLEPAATAAIKEAVNSLAETYHANVKLEPQYDRAIFAQVIDGPKHRVIPTIALEVANDVIGERLVEFEEQSIDTLGEGLFVVTDEELPLEQARRWLDYVEQTKELPVFLQFVALGREFTILCRTHDLLAGLILRQQAGYAG